MKTKVSIEHVLEVSYQKQLINALNFNDIEWTKDGKVLNIPQDVKDEFSFTGLNNMDFIISGFYKNYKPTV